MSTASSPTRRPSPRTSGTCPSATTSPQDVCDKHPADKLAMIHEDFDGHRPRGPAGASCRSSPTASPTCCARTASSKGDRVAMLLPPTPETAAAFFGTWKCGRDPALDVGALRRRRHPPPRDATRRPRCSSPTRPTGTASTRRWSSTCCCSTTSCSRAATPDVRRASTPLADDPAQLYYSSGTTGLAKGIVHAHRYLLAHEEFVYCHDVQDGERFHGMGEWAWAAGIAPLLGPWRYGAVQLVLPARGRLRPAQAARLPLAPRGRRTSSRRRPRCAR